MSRKGKQKMKKAMLIETLEKMQTNCYDCADHFEEDGNEKMVERLHAEAAAYATVIGMLKNNDFAERLRAIYC